LDWIEIQLVDPDGTMGAGVADEITLPGGSTQKGNLDATGKARYARSCRAIR